MRSLGVLIWHVHGSYLETFVRGKHRYLLPVRDGSPAGRRRAHWPRNVVEITPEAAREETIDVVVLQRREEVADVVAYLGGRIPGRDVPTIFLEHNAPQGRINEMVHPFADRDDVTIVHVTHFNALFWATGSTRTVVVEHGVADPGTLYTGELARCAIVINEAKRRGRVTGTDLLPAIDAVAPVDLYGIGTERDLPQRELYADMSRRRVYVHPFRWTSLGLALLEAMACGMPVVALATTEVPAAVPPDCGVVSNRLDAIASGIRRFMSDPADARAVGARARSHVLAHYGLPKFLAAWDDVLHAVTRTPPDS
jgi:glycosyltransferase involved in cell wall biosynthesis